MSVELLAHGRAIWDELLVQCADGPLPFVKFDPSSPGAVISFWDVAESGDQAKDLTFGLGPTQSHEAVSACDAMVERMNRPKQSPAAQQPAVR